MAPKSGATRLTPTTDPLAALLTEIRACRICEEHLPLGPRPVVVATASARVLIAGQAPGTRVHESGVPWDDASGDRLREWLDLDRDVFYDDSRVAIVPQGFCYPGKAAGGDLPPRPECALTWHDRLLAQLPNVNLIVAAGRYAQKFHLGERNKKTLSETVRAWRDYAPAVVPVPHPSWHNNRWLTVNPWFEHETLTYLRKRVRRLIG